ncbi:MAG: response regulator [Mesorhizobium sp.]
MERRPLTVAIIEDDTSMRKSIERLLNAYGFAAIGFASAEAFLERQIDDAFVCAVLDVHLPGINGFELKRRLMAAGEELPIIFVTAIDDDVREYVTQAGCVAYLRKPFAPDRLLEAVKSAIAAR